MAGWSSSACAQTRFRVEILNEVCERYVFVQNGRLTHARDVESLLALEPMRAYFGWLVADLH